MTPSPSTDRWTIQRGFTLALFFGGIGWAVILSAVGVL